MDDVVTRHDVSCRNLYWCFELCSQKNIDPRRVMRGVSHPVEHLKDPSKFIDWQNYANFISNFSKYLTEEDLIEAGRKSWNSSNLRIFSYVGRLLFTVKDQYLALFGPFGEIAKTFPVDISVIQTSNRKLRISIKMNPGCSRCHIFHVILAGQMIGLPESLGFPKASVQLSRTDKGAVYDISYSSDGGLLAPLRKAVMWIFTARETARELTTTYDSLLRKYRELQEETDKLREAEKKVQASEEKYRLLAANVNDIIWTMDMDLKFQYISPAIYRITGYTESELIDMSLDQLLVPESLALVINHFERELAAGSDLDLPSTVEVAIISKTGQHVWLEIRASFIVDDDNNPVTLIGVARDISERKKMEGELNEKETNYQVITDTAQDAIITIDQSNRINFANPASINIFGYENAELIGMDIALLMPESLGETRLRELYRPESLEPRSGVTVKGLRKDRTLIPLELSFATHEISGATYRTCFVRDISARTRNEQERKQLEQQLHASQKMESIGQLTGVSHTTLTIYWWPFSVIPISRSVQSTTTVPLKTIYRKSSKRGAVPPT